MAGEYVGKYEKLTKVVKSGRVVGTKYLDSEGRVGIWSGVRLFCEHGKNRPRCKDCGGSGICVHNREKMQCKDCGGASICEHNKVRSRCRECGGVSICKHNRMRYACNDCKAVYKSLNAVYPIPPVLIMRVEKKEKKRKT